MASTFAGLSIASRGLLASQIGTATTTNNMSNVNTPGYSRQVVNQVAIGPAAVYSRNTVGAGADVTSVSRVNSYRLNQKYWQQNCSLGEWLTKTEYLTEIEKALGTSSNDNGFSNMMKDFYAALESLSTNAGDSAARAKVYETGNAVCEYFKAAAKSLTQLRNDANNEVKTTVDQINSYAKQITELNQQISTAASAGASTNELEDRRDLLVDELSKLTDVNVTANIINTASDGTTTASYTVSINGQELISGNNARQLECCTITDDSAQNGMYGIKWADTGDSFNVSNSGTLKACMDLRDGSGSAGNGKGIPYYMSKLDNFARTFAKAFNEGIYADGKQYYGGHAGGYGLDGTTGVRFFTCDGESTADFLAGGTDTATRYNKITAANISLSSDVKDNNKIAAASQAPSGLDTTTGSNNQNAADLLRICKDSRMFNSGTPVDYYNSVISTLGTETSYASRENDRQTNMVSYIGDSRAAVSGVSENEEMANFSKYQQAYIASSKAVTTWSEIYEATINMVSD
ncbi:hypothetical protein P22_1426 [Propionispora sp. 2/2-37]|uniref:flagellar hook-associated protein FlgK n=1 Tax=Propionispora sp. 2/2-37 TaxID=1677858 RepID=UPI0006BB57AD|nr:flagellar hook-associated protein FlgK [Propionispora sp. 2/2-37]CUH95356.1 hypothetical protein P22_1426 [Propionispora sp. 2/2-37]